MVHAKDKTENLKMQSLNCQSLCEEIEKNSKVHILRISPSKCQMRSIKDSIDNN